MPDGPTVKEQIFAHDWIELTTDHPRRNKLTFTAGNISLRADHPGLVNGDSNLVIYNGDWHLYGDVLCSERSARGKLVMDCEQNCEVMLKLQLERNLAGELRLRASTETCCNCMNDGPYYDGEPWVENVGTFRIDEQRTPPRLPNWS